MLDKNVRCPVARDTYDTGCIKLFTPHDVEIAPSTRVHIDFAVAIRFPPGLAGTIRLRPHLIATIQLRVVEPFFGNCSLVVT